MLENLYKSKTISSSYTLDAQTDPWKVGYVSHIRNGEFRMPSGFGFLIVLNQLLNNEKWRSLTETGRLLSCWQSADIRLFLILFCARLTCRRSFVKPPNRFYSVMTNFSQSELPSGLKSDLCARRRTDGVNHSPPEATGIVDQQNLRYWTKN